ncbi:MAG: hypothetical protein FJ312_08510 [SAR202 cluster bacterium]|nr:hypothetical protein [SAR202 cluster bacterium]
MNVLEKKVGRRTVLKGAAIASLALLARPLARSGQVQAQATTPRILAALVDKVPTDEADPSWDKARLVTIALGPQNLVVPRVQEAGAKEIDVRAVYDADRVAFLVRWKDAHRNVDLGTVMTYRDAVAIQFPQDPAAGTTSFMMGQRGRGVTVYHWKSDWQFGRLHDVDEAYPNMYSDWYQHSGVEAGKIPEASDYLTKGRKEYLTAAAAGNALADPLAQEKIGPLQKMRAEGFGTIEPDETQDGQGFGVWKDGEWRIVFSFPRAQSKFRWGESETVPVGFAVWDGSRNERNGQKAFSDWQDMQLASPIEEVVGAELPPPAEKSERNILGPVLGGVLGGAALLGVGALIAVRMRKAPPESKSG